MAAPTQSVEEMAKMIADLQNQLQKEKDKNDKKTFKLKVTEKGGVSAYLGGRFPVTQYFDGWMTILDNADEIRKFLEDNKDQIDKLSKKSST